MRVRVIHSKNLSSECLSVQAWGLAYCRTCPFKNTKNCGGKRIRKLLQNLLGQKVPIE